MSKPYKLIKDGVVVNTIIAEEVESIAHMYDSIEEVIDPPPVFQPPVPVTTIQAVDFLQRFTTAERISFRNTTTTNGVAEDLLHYLQDPRIALIDVASQYILDGMAELVTQGVITEARKQEIIALN